MKWIALIFVMACTAPVGSTIDVPRNSAATCAGYCQSIGLPLQSVVIMANNVGCVCNAQPAAPSGAPAASGGVTAVMMAEEARRQQDAQRHQQSQVQHTPPRY